MSEQIRERVWDVRVVSPVNVPDVERGREPVRCLGCGAEFTTVAAWSEHETRCATWAAVYDPQTGVGLRVADLDPVRRLGWATMLEAAAAHGPSRCAETLRTAARVMRESGKHVEEGR